MMEGGVTEMKPSPAKGQVYRPMPATDDFSGTYILLLLIKLTLFENR